MILKVKNPTLQWIKKISNPVILEVCLISIIGMLDALLGVLVALQSKNVIDYAMSRNLADLKASSMVLGGMIIIQFIMSFLYMRLSSNIVARRSLNLQKDIFKNVMYMDYERSSMFHTGELLNRITTDADTVMCSIIGIIPQILIFVTGVITAFVALLIIEPIFALLCVAVGIVVAVGTVLWGKRLKKVTLECRKWNDRCNSFMLECVQNIMVVKSFCNENKAVKHAGEIQEGTYKSLKRRNTNKIMASLASSLFFTLGYFLALGWGAFGIAFGVQSYGSLMAMVQLVSKLQSPFKGIASVIPQYYQMMASAERLMDIINYEEENVGKEIRDFENIEFKNVSFSYNNNETVIKNADFKINKGDFIMVSGISGIGKSTLFKLLLSMYSPDKGEIIVGLKDGNTVKLDKNCRNLFSYVPQGNMILSGTVEDNVMFFSEKNDRKRVEECLKISCLWDDVCEMPKKIYTVLGEGGVGLSEGQIQRLAVARALYHDAKILLLDESTSALDYGTELKMLDNIRKIQDITCVMISHKSSAEKYMDKKLMIKDGTVSLVQINQN